MEPEFAFKTIREISNGFSRKNFSPCELLDDVIARYELLEPKLNMFAHVDFDSARIRRPLRLRMLAR